MRFDPCDGKKRAVSVLTPSPSKHLVASTENLIFLNADFIQSMFTKRSKTRISQKTCRTFSIVMIMILHGHVQSVWSTSTCQEARALGQRSWFSTPWETMSFAQELMFTANRIENNHDSKIVLALKNNCTCFKHLLCQPRKTRLQERQKKTHRVSSNKKRPSDDIA